MKAKVKGLVRRSSQYLAKLKGEARQRRMKRGQDRLVARASAGAQPRVVFNGLDDELWLWANTAGYREYQALRNLLPAMPAESIQARFTGATGDDTVIRGFAAYTQIKELTEKYLGKVSGLNNILDFGCGWGRMVRLFLRDLDPPRIWGADCLPNIIEVCEQTNRWCNFRVVDPLPPSSFSDEMFDLIYSYSVFSHLSEEAHWKWLLEFKRILRPGGLLIATTRHRQFVEYCKAVRTSDCDWQPAIAWAFPNTEQSLSDYDNGKYCHSPLAGGDILDESFFGETCIPKGYVMDHWTREFSFLEYIESPDRLIQNTIVVRKSV